MVNKKELDDLKDWLSEQLDVQNTKLYIRFSELNTKYEIILQETRDTRQNHNDLLPTLEGKQQEVDGIKFVLSNQADCIKSL